jgi:hypothetical protein
VTVVVAIIGASAKIASGSLVSGEAVASAIVAIALVIAVVLAGQQGAVESCEALLAVAGHVECAHTISSAVVGANTSLALNSGVTCLAQAHTVLANSVVIAVAWACSQAAIAASPLS